MTKQQYAQQRLDPRWQKKRLEVMARDGWKCLECGDEKETLNVHHCYYIKGRQPWDYPLWSLRTLCKECHADAGATPSDFARWEYAVEIISGGKPVLLEEICDFVDINVEHEADDGVKECSPRDFVTAMRSLVGYGRGGETKVPF